MCVCVVVGVVCVSEPRDNMGPWGCVLGVLKHTITVMIVSEKYGKFRCRCK